MSSAGVVESLKEAVVDLLATGLAFGRGVVALGLEGGSELDGGDEEGAGLADRLVVAVKISFRMAAGSSAVGSTAGFCCW